MNDREKSLLMMLEIERLGKENCLPFVCVIGIPDEGGCTRASLGLTGPENAGNREAFEAFVADYFIKIKSV